jgi:hypothetical protein
MVRSYVLRFQPRDGKMERWDQGDVLHAERLRYCITEKEICNNFRVQDEAGADSVCVWAICDM